MNPKNVLFTLALLLAFIFIFISRTRQEPRTGEAFNRHPHHLVYTKHALCRMDCRHISKADIKTIMEKGIINLGRSDRNDKPCPVFAMQGQTEKGESLRVIFAQCNDETKVVTCYNLTKDFVCDCP